MSKRMLKIFNSAIFKGAGVLRTHAQLEDSVGTVK